MVKFSATFMVLTGWQTCLLSITKILFSTQVNETSSLVMPYRVYTNMRGSDFEYFINEKWLFAPEEHPVCSKIRG